MTRRRSRRGNGFLYQKVKGGTWYCQVYDPAGRRITRSTRTTDRAEAQTFLHELYATLGKAAASEPIPPTSGLVYSQAPRISTPPPSADAVPRCSIDAFSKRVGTTLSRLVLAGRCFERVGKGLYRLKDLPEVDAAS